MPMLITKKKQGMYGYLKKHRTRKDTLTRLLEASKDTLGSSVPSITHPSVDGPRGGGKRDKPIYNKDLC